MDAIQPRRIGTKHKARYIMIGGFLGAGKTTAVARLAKHLSNLGVRVGLITNDQGQNLVDAANKLTEQSRPDVFIAEPVGSCTDLVATVTYPLRRLYGENFTVAPVSVLADPIRAMRVLGLDKGGSFSPKV